MEQEQGKESKNAGKNRVGRRIAAAAVLFVVLIAAAAGAGGLYIKNSLSPMPAGSPVNVTIPPGTGSAEIARLLESNGIIRNHQLFTYYLKAKKEGSRFQAGTYELSPGMSNDAIIAKLNMGDTVKEEVLRFTIPEGFTIEQIADKLSGDGIVDRKAFLELADSANIWDPKLPSVPKEADVKHPLEGYLFPETYEMKKDSTAKDIIARMLAETAIKLQELPADWQSKMSERKVSFSQLMTIASLIEREVAVDEERPLVAGVIYNRLNADMPLQIDATIQYLFEKPKERLLEKDLRIESLYNTYLHPGLPPGPIASPSLASIRAALYPKESKYLFYVTKKDGSGRHLFAETFEQHKKNIAKSKSGS